MLVSRDLLVVLAVGLTLVVSGGGFALIIR